MVKKLEPTYVDNCSSLELRIFRNRLIIVVVIAKTMKSGAAAKNAIIAPRFCMVAATLSVNEDASAIVNSVETTTTIASALMEPGAVVINHSIKSNF